MLIRSRFVNSMIRKHMHPEARTLLRTSQSIHIYKFTLYHETVVSKTEVIIPSSLLREGRKRKIPWYSGISLADPAGGRPVWSVLCNAIWQTTHVSLVHRPSARGFSLLCIYGVISTRARVRSARELHYARVARK